MNKKAEGILLKLLLEIIETNSVFSQTKATLLQELINEVRMEQESER